MVNSFFPPKPGQRILLLCTRCNSSFYGPNPRTNSPFKLFITNTKTAKCPNCNSRKVVPHPAIQY